MAKRNRIAPRPKNQLSYEPLEPKQLLAGDVGVSVRAGNLILSGDNLGNTVSIVRSDSGTVSVEGTDTLINGSKSEFVYRGELKNVTLRMLGGDDQIRISGIEARSLVVDLGRGDDLAEIDSTTARDVRINAGVGDDVLQIVSLVSSRRTMIATGQGDDVVSIVALSTGKDFHLTTASGDDSVCVDDLNVGGKLNMHMGSGNDELMFAGQTQPGGRTNLFLGSGDDLLAMLPGRNGQTSNLGERLTIHSGSGNDAVAIDNAVTLSSAHIFGGGGNQDEFQNDAKTTNSFRDLAFESNLVSDLDQRITQVYEELDNAGINPAPFGAAVLTLDPETQLVTANDPTPTTSVMWDKVAQQAVANLGVGPTIGSRAYAMVHTAMFDAWSAYDLKAVSTQLEDTLQRPASENSDANKQHAMSFAAYRVLTDLFPSEIATFDALMSELGYNVANQSTDATTPAGIGNRMAAALLAFRHADGSNQLGEDPNGTLGVPYSSNADYEPVNEVDNIIEIEFWTPERVPIDAVPGTEERIQSFLTPQWGNVTPFGTETGEALRPIAPEPFLLVEGTVDLDAKTITVTGQSPVAIDKSLIGSVINPEFIAQAQAVIDFSANLDDEQKMIAEFWEDGGGTSFPPGTWMTFGQFTSARDDHSIDEDAQMFFALGNAVMDAGITTWEAKTFYDYVRPVRAIRELGELGLIGEFDDQLGGFAIDAWQPGVGTTRILADQFLTYQTPGSDPSPPFSEYTSGHSAFSAAAAEVLRLFTGSDHFGAKVTFQPGESRFEPGITPSAPLTLAWSSYSIAADEAGISRLYGGIHFSDGDINGRALGRQAGQSAWDRARSFINA